MRLYGLRIREPSGSSGRRAKAVAFGLGAVFSIIALKGAALSLSGPSASDRLSSASIFEAPAGRADIVDRNGELLATSIDTYSLFADPRAIWDPEDTADALASVLDGVDAVALSNRLANRDRAFVWVKRQITPRQRQAVFALGLEGLGFRKETRRAYPGSTLAGHLIGYTNIDGKGLSGLELSHDAALTAGGAPLKLTIDAGVQFILESELADTATTLDAIGGAGVILDARTGEIRALASWPTLNPNRARTLAADDPSRFNRAVAGVYELGSVFKPLTIAAAIDAGAVAPDDAIDVADPIEIGGHEIGDLHPIDSPATVTRIISESSNIGTALINARLGQARQRTLLERAGLTEAPAGDVSGAAPPILPDRWPEQWSEVSSATMSYGHGLAISPLSFVSAFAAFGNEGVRMPLSLVADDDGNDEPFDGTRVFSDSTVDAVLPMLRETVVTGTGRAADVPGYQVAGKTGTAEKVVDGGYDPDRNLNSFAAVFPAERPQYAILIVLDEAKAPQRGEGSMVGDTAATTAAPLVAKVIARAAPLLGVMPRWDTPPEVEGGRDRAALERSDSG